MANSAGMATSFKGELFLGAHQLGAVTIVSRTSLTAPTKDTLKAALFLASGSLAVSLATYNGTSEVSGAGYSAGGVTVTNAVDPSTSGTTAIWTPSANFVWAGVTLATSFDCCQLYNSTQGNRSIATFTFGAQTITAGTFTLTMPTNDASNALLRIA